MAGKKEHKGTLPEQPVAIADIARLAGVSISTVSRVLNSSPEVKKSTRSRILKLIQELDYMPSEVARGLATRTSRTICLLIPDIANYYYSELIRSVEAVVSRNGFSLLLCITNTDPGKEEYYINEMLRRRIDGFLILSTVISDPRLLERMHRSAKVVSVEADVPGADKVSCGNEQGTYEVIRHLIECGHRDIGFVGYQLNMSGLQQRMRAYKRALREYGIPLNEQLVVIGTALGNSGFNMAQRLLAIRPRPTAIHCMNEYLAAGAYRAVAEAGLAIPDDISITAFDGQESSELLTPKLTTAAIPIGQMGEAAAEMLLRAIAEKGKGEEKEPGKEKEVLFPARLVVRGSTRRV